MLSKHNEVSLVIIYNLREINEMDDTENTFLWLLLNIEEKSRGGETKPSPVPPPMNWNWQ